MRPLIILLSLTFSVASFAQLAQRSSVGMGGATTTLQQGDKTYYVSSSIGQQSVIGTFSSDNAVLRQGFQQAPISVLRASNSQDELEAVVFPNPVESIVTITFNETIASEISGIVFDIQGKEVLRFSTNAAQSIDLDMTHLSSGAYALIIAVKEKNFTTRLLKN